MEPTDPAAVTEWHRDRELFRQGFRDLQYLPKGRCAWNMTLAALAYGARRVIREHVEHLAPRSTGLNAWAARHGVPAGARYADLGSDALVLWHGTSAARAQKIKEHGLMCNRGVWATTNPMIAHGFARSRCQAFQAGSAVVVLLLDQNAWEGRATLDTPTIARFRESIPRECIEYIAWDDHIEFLGQRSARGPRSWVMANFKRRDGKWVPRSKPPVRFDGEASYADLDTWLELSVRRLAETLRVFTAVEVFSSLYATVAPFGVLEHRQVFDAIDRLCRPTRRLPGGFRAFALSG